jgi:excisionase family DNA binding protein
MHTPDLVDVNESARITGLRAQTLYRLARQGRIKSFRVLRRAVRFDRSELLELVRERRGERVAS